MTDSKGFIDAQCPKCRAKIGWYGRVVDRPACHRCGHKPPAADLEHDQAEIDNFRELLAELRQANPGWDKWQRARVAAGLTLRQAAKLLSVLPTQLSEIEQGKVRPSEEFAKQMSECYGG